MNITSTLTKTGAKVLFKAKDALPEILIGTGVVGVLAGVVFACKETPKAVEIVAEHNEMMERIHEVHENPDQFSADYTDKDYRKDVCVQWSNTAWRLIRNYAPAATILAVSIAMILYSHGMLSKRNLELLAAYKTLEESFAAYREKHGDKKQLTYASDETKDISVTEATEGKEQPIGIGPSPYARFFDETNVNWEKDPTTNMFFLQAQEKFANQKLNSRGFLFLNDVYEALGFPKTSAGQLVGWYLGGEGDNYVSFGIFDPESERKRDFVNGFERSILLDFNVDGVIYDLI